MEFSSLLVVLVSASLLWSSIALIFFELLAQTITVQCMVRAGTGPGQRSNPTSLMTKKRIFLIAGARPNFMKVAPLFHALGQEDWCEPVLINTGQHYDPDMSDTFMVDLGLPPPDINLGVGSGSHAEQTGAVMVAIERVSLEQKPDWVVVVGDVNSTLAAALAARKIGISVAHVEAGLRSRDWSMPEEINRVVTDSISNLLLTPSEDADENLLKEGVSPDKIVRVGNIMMDSYELLRSRIASDPIASRLGVSAAPYGVVTLHRPFNVDEEENLTSIVEALVQISERLKLIFPLHPRTRMSLEQFGLLSRLGLEERIVATAPLSYIPFMSLLKNAVLAITDSGGLQEETTYLNVPCLTLRPNTERPVTVSQGTNRLANAGDLVEKAMSVLDGSWRPKGACPELWDGKAAPRIVQALRACENT